MTDLQEIENAYLIRRARSLPWEEKTPGESIAQAEFQNVLRRHAGAVYFGDDSFVSPGAHIYTDRFQLGARGWVASGAIIRGDVSIGDESTVNAFAHIAGHVQIGANVMIAGMAAIYGFNHGFDRVDISMREQGITSKGIRISDGVWVGTNAIILDGVHVGEHSIVAAGAVVTRDSPPFAIIAGNPARVIRLRTASGKGVTSAANAAGGAEVNHHQTLTPHRRRTLAVPRFWRS